MLYLCNYTRFSEKVTEANVCSHLVRRLTGGAPWTVPVRSASASAAGSRRIFGGKDAHVFRTHSVELAIFCRK